MLSNNFKQATDVKLLISVSQIDGSMILKEDIVEAIKMAESKGIDGCLLYNYQGKYLF